MKTRNRFLSPLLITLTILTTQCGGLSGDSQNTGDGDAPDSGSTVVLRAIGTENDACAVIGVDSEIVGIDLDGRVGFNLDMTGTMLVTGSGEEEDPFETTADPESFSLQNAAGQDLDVTFSLDAEMNYIDADADSDDAGSFIATNRANLTITGLTNPAVDTTYVITIPEGSISCEDGEVIGDGYEIEFVLMATTTESSGAVE